MGLGSLAGRIREAVREKVSGAEKYRLGRVHEINLHPEFYDEYMHTYSLNSTIEALLVAPLERIRELERQGYLIQLEQSAPYIITIITKGNSLDKFSLDKSYQVGEDAIVKFYGPDYTEQERKPVAQIGW